MGGRFQRGTCTKRPALITALQDIRPSHSKGAPFPLSIHLPLSHPLFPLPSLILSSLSHPAPLFPLSSLCRSSLGCFSPGYDLIGLLLHDKKCSLVLAACWALWLWFKVKKCHLWVFFDHVCVLFCNQSNVWCSYMLAC